MGDYFHKTSSAKYFYRHVRIHFGYYKSLQVTCGVLQVTCGVLQVTCAVLQVTCAVLQVTCADPFSPPRIGAWE